MSHHDSPLTDEAATQSRSPQSPRSSSTTPQNDLGKGVAFKLIIVSLWLSVFLAALDLTVVATALPVIVRDLHGEQFSWVANAYAMTSTAFLPLAGGLAEIFGRKLSMMVSLAIFAFGSALCGAAQTMHWLIAARAVQGLGSQGLIAFSSIIVADLVPLRERGAYNGVIGLSWAVASAAGPIVGGAIASHGQWRWIFYMNLPICGLAGLAVFLFLQIPTPTGSSLEKLARVDWIGNIIVVPSITGIMLGLTWGGTTYTWASAAVLVPLLVGFGGLCMFLFYEAQFASQPIVPFTLLNDRTVLSGYAQNFLYPVIVLSIPYYLPVYFQACKDADPLHSSILMLPFSLVFGPVVFLAGLSVKIFQSYRVQHWLGWIVLIAGLGSFSTITADAPLSVVLGLPILFSTGGGILYAVTYFPVLAPLPVTANAKAISLLQFLRSFATVWGITIAATILQNELKAKLPAKYLAELSAGRADLAYTIISEVRTLPEPVKDQVREAFAGSLAVLWKTLAAISACGLVVSFFFRGLPLQQAPGDGDVGSAIQVVDDGKEVTP